jgi:hypothetical protein
MDPLFKAAVSCAIRDARIRSAADASEERSRQTGKTYVLAKADGRVIDRIPIERVNREIEKAISQLKRQEENAARNSEEAAFRQHRDKIRARMGAPRFATSGAAGCVSALLLGLGIILIFIVWPVGLFFLLIGAIFFVAGSSNVSSERGLIAAADAEAVRSWKDSRESAQRPSPLGDQEG